LDKRLAESLLCAALDMKNSPLTIVAVVFLGLLTLFTAFTYWRFSREQNKLNGLNNQLSRIQYDRYMVNALANDAAGYAVSNHPAILPILEARGFHVNKPNPGTDKAGTK
jgi:hypothetical protein